MKLLNLNTGARKIPILDEHFRRHLEAFELLKKHNLGLSHNLEKNLNSEIQTDL